MHWSLNKLGSQDKSMTFILSSGMPFLSSLVCPFTAVIPVTTVRAAVESFSAVAFCIQYIFALILFIMHYLNPFSLVLDTALVREDNCHPNDDDAVCCM